MSDDIRRYLDGELSLEALPADAQASARSWDRMLEAFQAEMPGEEAPAWLEDRVMAEIEALPRPGSLGKAWEWLLRPRPFQVSPGVLGLAAAAIAAVMLIPRGDIGSPGPVEGEGQVAAVVYVQFLLEAPSARSVSVGGDFDGWSGAHALEDPDGDGVWTGRVPVEPGLHSYMFLLDGAEWVTDPQASRYNDDGFGNRNAVLAVAAPRT